MRFAGGGASLCATHRCASFPASLCKYSLPLAPLLSSSVANGIDKKKKVSKTERERASFFCEPCEREKDGDHGSEIMPRGLESCRATNGNLVKQCIIIHRSCQH